MSYFKDEMNVVLFTLLKGWIIKLTLGFQATNYVKNYRFLRNHCCAYSNFSNKKWISIFKFDLITFVVLLT